MPIYKTARNERLEQFKILFQFVLMSVCSLVIGAFLSNIFSEQYYTVAQSVVSTHFEKLFLGYSDLLECMRAVIRYSSFDIICILAVFAVSFAVFNYAATDIILVVCGIKTGFSIAFLSEYVSNEALAYNLGVLRFTVYAVFKAALLLLLFTYSYRAAVYSISLNRTTANGRWAVTFKKLLPFLALTLAYIGAVIITNGAYCWIIYMLK